MAFTKYDADKPPIDLLPRRALWEVARVLGHGAVKYGKRNYDSPAERDTMGRTQDERYEGALLRHALTLEGDVDRESGLYHLAHVAANALLLLEKKLEVAE